jgi:hypothetical protein
MVKIPISESFFASREERAKVYQIGICNWEASMKKVAEELRFFDVQPNYFNFDRIDLSGCTFKGLFPGVCDALVQHLIGRS